MSNEDHDLGKAKFSKIKPNLFSNYYAILSDTAPPTCQVEEQDHRHRANALSDITNVDNQLRRGVLNGSIPSAIADSGATSHVGTTKDSARHAFVPTGNTSNKVFQLPDRTRTPASDIHQLHHNVRQ